MADVKRGLYNRWNFELAKFASKEESRFNPNAIQVEPDATATTDGVMLLRVTSPELSLSDFPEVPGQTLQEVKTPFLFPADASLKVAKSIPRKTSIPVLETAAALAAGEENVGFVSTDLETANPVIARKPTGTFPGNYQAQFPEDKDKVFSIKLDGRRLGEIVRFLTAFGDQGRLPTTITLTFYRDGKPVKLEAKNSDTGQEAVAILMPMRD